ncbi:hypothetical protein WICPIJ_008171 [Wickerhamomyces pijperi]|uniref:Fork-head domain-containing protein n=1 Tax=Wickerhamomyces pijperi TaxID=599730 RepID=A0A9P8TJK2_WICPI|nr:hypothetical protein WICPIJ_008171 [Wickerhamomyces pijperi]
MQGNPDLNSNLMKSLSSAYLPPPPAQILSSEQAKLPTADALQEASQIEGQSAKSKRSKRRSSTTEELILPLTTPPHSITRSNNEASTSTRKRNQTTPTLSQSRSKSNQNPISPQYSSPNTSMSELPPVKPLNKKQSKIPQPTFTVTKPKQAPVPIQIHQTTNITLNPPRPQTPEPAKEEDEDFELPSPGSMPEIVFDCGSKPPFSYATLIGMAILRGEDRKLTLSQIYSWISNTFRFYRKDELGWQNSIRHNLSLNKAFIKTDKSSDGKGHYWEVVEGHELQFVKGKPGKKIENIKKDVPKKKPQKKSDISGGESEAENGIEANKAKANTSVADEKVISSTPKKQIRSVDYDEKPQIKKSNSVIGLQRCPRGLDSDVDSELDEGLVVDFGQGKPAKKKQLHSISVTDGQSSNMNGFLDFSVGEHSNPNSSIGGFNDSSKFSFTSSFSSVTNFEMSPIRSKDSGPLLEPLTPTSRLASFNQPTFNPPNKTPLRNTTNSTNGLSGISSTQTSKFHNFLKTPITKTRTPNSNSIMKKFWNSPAFIDDFYASPSVQRYAVDRTEMISKRLFGSPETNRSMQGVPDQASGSRSQFYEHSSNFPSGYSDLFGVDIHSVVQRAVEKEKINQQIQGSATREEESMSTDDDMDN